MQQKPVQGCVCEVPGPSWLKPFWNLTAHEWTQRMNTNHPHGTKWIHIGGLLVYVYTYVYICVYMYVYVYIYI